MQGRETREAMQFCAQESSSLRGVLGCPGVFGGVLGPWVLAVATGYLQERKALVSLHSAEFYKQQLKACSKAISN